MQITKITIPQAVEFFKKNDLWAKIAFTIAFLSYLSLCHSCFNPIAGDTYPIYENNYPGDVFGFRAKNKGAKQCELGGKKIFLERENQNESFWYDFFVDSGDLYVWHLQYQDDDGSRKNILTYRFAPHGGIGAVVQGTGIGINDGQDSIVIIYDAEPLDGFTIEPSPFSDKIVIQKSAPSDVKKRGPGKEVISAHCAMEWFN
ncbi:hypothetical protein [Fibrobacter sp.]|uniref:hypothetical protein n=1 Tax=Fibrobacter sp. TaxID=35828 RepID=UPI0038653DA8